MTWETFYSKNHTQNTVEKLVTDPFLKSENWACLWINSLKFYAVFFHCMPSWGLSKYNETKILAFTSCYAFLKNKEKSGTSLLAIFSAWFLNENISFDILY